MELPDCRRSRGCGLYCGAGAGGGADIAAATGRVGAAALGGGWELGAAVLPPLTGPGIAEYAAVLATKNWIGPTGSTAPLTLSSPPGRRGR